MKKTFSVFCLSSLFLFGCGGGSGNSDPKVEVEVNQAPTIANMTTALVNEGEMVEFIAQVADIDGSISSYLWQQTAGTPVLELQSNSATLSFLTPDINNDETLSFSLTITDNDNASATATLELTAIANLAPTIANMATTLVYEGEMAEFTAQVADIDGSISSYLWQQTAGTPVLELQSDSVTLSFLTPDINNDELLIFSLSTTDNDNAITTAILEINAINNLAPVIETMAAVTIKENENFSFTADVSDTDGEVVQYAWQQTTGSEVSELLTDSATLSFIAPDIETNEILTFLLTVTDNSQNITTAELEVQAIIDTVIPQDTVNDQGLADCLVASGITTFTIKEISCDGFIIASLSDLEKFTHLEQLTLTNAELVSIPDLPNPTKLKLLDLSHNNIANANKINDFTSLTTLNLSYNEISGDMFSIFSLPALKVANLNTLDKGDGFKLDWPLLNLINSTELTHLDLSNNSLYRHNILANFTKLTELKLTNTDFDNDSLDYLTALPLLTTLDLAQNDNIDDISPLAQISSLTALNLSNNSKLMNIDPLLGLTQLSLLDLNNSPAIACNDFDLLEQSLTDAQIIRHENCVTNPVDFSLFTDQKLLDCVKNKSLEITEVTTLSCSGVTDLTGIEQLTSIDSLYLLSGVANPANDVEGITDLSPLSDLVKLESLALDNHNIDNLSPLAPLTELKLLILSNSELTDISTLPSLGKLQALYLNNNEGLSDISALSSLTSLTGLHLQNSNISDLTPLSSLVNLNVLNLWNNNIGNLSPLSSLINLENLSLSDNNITALTGLSSLTKLTELSLGKNNISDLSPLSTLTKLNQLHLKENEISDLSPLSSIVNLKGLFVHENNIIELTGISTLTQLTELALSDNEIIDISALASLTILESLAIGNNQITSLLPLFFLSALESIDLSGNDDVNCDEVNTLEDNIPQGGLGRPAQCN